MPFRRKKPKLKSLGLFMFLLILGVNAASLDNMGELIDEKNFFAYVVGTRMMTSTSTETPLPESNHTSSSGQTISI